MALDGLRWFLGPKILEVRPIGTCHSPSSSHPGYAAGSFLLFLLNLAVKLLKKHSHEHRGGYIKPSSASTTCCIGGQPCRTGREEGTYVCSHQLPKYPITTPLVSLSPNLRLLAPPLLSPSLTHAHIRFHVSGASHPSNSL